MFGYKNIQLKIKSIDSITMAINSDWTFCTSPWCFFFFKACIHHLVQRNNVHIISKDIVQSLKNFIWRMRILSAFLEGKLNFFQQSLIRIMPPKMIWIPTKSRNKVYIYKSGLKSSILTNESWLCSALSLREMCYFCCSAPLNKSFRSVKVFVCVICARCIRTFCLSACRRMKIKDTSRICSGS